MKRLNLIIAILAVFAVTAVTFYGIGYNKGHADGYFRGRSERTSEYLRNPWLNP